MGWGRDADAVFAIRNIWTLRVGDEAISLHAPVALWEPKSSDHKTKKIIQGVLVAEVLAINQVVALMSKRAVKVSSVILTFTTDTGKNTNETRI